MSQAGFDWDTTVCLPVSGDTPEARHASATGARVAAERRAALALAYRRLLVEVGPHSDPEAAKVLGRQLSSICSTRNGFGVKVQPSGDYESTDFGTKRVKWCWAKVIS